MKKIFTLLTLALISIGSAWGQTTIFSLTTKDSGGKEETVAREGGTLVLNTTDHLSTLTGGTVTLKNKKTGTGSAQKMMGSDNSEYHIRYSDNAHVVIITIDDENGLAEGDIITFTSNVEKELCFTTTETRATTIATTSKSYEVTGSSALKGAKTIYIWRVSDSTYLKSLTITRPAPDTRSELTLSFTPDNQIVGVGSTLTTALNWTEDTSAESAKYVTTYSSSSNAIATVSTTGVVTGVAAGTATITATVTAAADATYKTTKATITVNVNEPLAKNDNILLPSATLDFTNAATASALLSKPWVKDYATYGNDGTDNYIVFSAFSGYQSSPYQTWMGVPANGESLGGGSIDGSDNWIATGIFKGKGAYSSVKVASAQSGRAYTYYSYRVKGSSKAQAYVKANSSSKYIQFVAYEIISGTPATSTLLYKSYTSTTDGVATLDLDKTKEYLIALYCTGTSNSAINELAFFFDAAVTLHESITPAKEYTTFVTTQAVDFSSVTGLEAYKATKATDSAVTIEKVTTVPAGTPLVLKGTASTTYAVPVIASATTPTDNLLKAGDGSTSIGGSSNKDYILVDGKFHHASSGKLAVGKAYLHIEDAGVHEVLAIIIDGDATAIKNIKVGSDDNVYYDLSGRRVLYPTKGLYIVNGKKVIIK